MILDSIFKIGTGIRQNHLANKIKPEYVPYEVSKYAQERLGLAGSLFNGRMRGAAARENNIGATGANATAGVMRNSTDASQALAIGAGIQQQSNNAYGDLAMQEAENGYNLLDNLNSAYGGMTDELDKVYQDKMNKYQIDATAKANLRSGAANNIAGGLDGIESAAIMAGQAAMGMPPTAGKGGGGQSSGVSGWGMGNGFNMGNYNQFRQRGF